MGKYREDKTGLFVQIIVHRGDPSDPIILLDGPADLLGGIGWSSPGPGSDIIWGDGSRRRFTGVKAETVVVEQG